MIAAAIAGRWGRGLPPPAGGGPRGHRERASQSLELALAMPIVALLGVAVLIAGMAGVEVSAVHAAAREAARAAAAGEDVHARLSAVGLGDLAVVRVQPSPSAARPGEPITVEVVGTSRALALLGAHVELRASAAAAREPTPGAAGGAADGARPGASRAASSGARR